MDAMETDLGRSGGDNMEKEVGGGPATHHEQGQDQIHGNVRSLLTLARHLINQGNPSLALQAVLVAMKSEVGEYAVFQTLHRARELYRNKLQANSAADELASLFAECVIAESQPLQSASPTLEASVSSMLSDVNNETSILAMTGRKQIMLDAFSDGSSFICLQCGGLVSNVRKDEHSAYWCG